MGTAPPPPPLRVPPPAALQRSRRLVVGCSVTLAVGVLALIALVAVATLDPLGWRSLSIDEVVAEFHDHGLTATVAASESAYSRRFVGIGFGTSLALYEFDSPADARQFARNSGLLYKNYAHRNIGLSCPHTKIAECQPYYAVLVSMR
jgi:hypothetical protein